MVSFSRLFQTGEESVWVDFFHVFVCILMYIPICVGVFLIHWFEGVYLLGGLWGRLLQFVDFKNFLMGNNICYSFS